jgi:hypothetical protein
VPQIASSVFISTTAPSIPATAGHEAWHSLRLDQPHDAALIGLLIQQLIAPASLETAQDAYKAYPPTQRAEEVAANIFSSIVNDPIFWKAYRTPNSQAIAKELEKANVPKYSEASLVRNWTELVKGIAKILRGNDVALSSSPTPSNVLRISPTVPTQTQLGDALAKAQTAPEKGRETITSASPNSKDWTIWICLQLLS